MATLNSLSVVLTGNATQLSSVLTRSAAEIRAFQQTAQGAGSAGSKGLALAAGGAAVVATALVYATTQAAEFQKAMLNVSTIDATVRNNLQQTSAQVLSLSTHLPQSAKELAEGLYDISSSGFQGAQSLNILKASATAASAGLSTTANAGKAITATLNAYGLSADQATRVSDTLFQTVNLGVVNFDELTAVIGDTVGTAAAAGVNIEQLGAAVATLTLSGLSASEAGTSLNRVLTSLIKPNLDLQKAQKQLGVSFTDELKDPAVGLKGVLDQLLNSVGGNRTAFANLFTDIRASRGVLALTAAGGANYTRVLQQMGIASDNTGSTQKALAQQSKGLSFQLNLLKNDFNDAAITVGTKLLPVLTSLGKGAAVVGTAIAHDLVAAAHTLQPVWEDLVGIGKNLLGMFHDLYNAASPVVHLLGGAVFAGAAAGLHGLGAAVQSTTGYLSHHETVLTAVVLAYAALNSQAIISKFVAIGTAVATLGGEMVTFAAVQVFRAIQGVDALGRSLLGASAATASSSAIFAAGGAALGIWAGFITVAAIALTSYGEDAKKAAQEADNFQKSLTAGVDTNSLDGVNTAISKVEDTLRGFGQEGSVALQGILSGKGIDAEFFNELNPKVTGAAHALEGFLAQQKKLQTTANNVQDLGKEYGLTATQVTNLATKNKVNLGGSLNDTTKTVNGHTVKVKGLITTYDKLLDTWSKTETAADPVRAAQVTLTAANKAQADNLTEVQKTWKDQIDLLQEYKGQSDVTAASIQANVTKNLQLLTDETGNIRTLIAKGASGQLIQQLQSEGPEFVAAGAQAGTSTIQGWNKAFVDQGTQTLAQQNLVNNALHPAAAKAQADAAARYAFAGFAEAAETSTDKALKIIGTLPVNASDQVRTALLGQRAKVLDAFLNTLPGPVREAVQQALTAAHIGSQNVASQIVSALIQAKPSAVFQANDLYTKVQGELDKLHGKDLQVVLDDLVSGNIPKLLTDLSQLSGAIQALPAGTIGIAAPGASVSPITGQLVGGFARGGNPFNGLVRGGTSMRADNRFIAVSDYEYVVQGPAAMKYGRSTMDSVNKGTAEIIPHFAQGGSVNDGYRTNLTTAPLANQIGQYDQVILSAIQRLQQQQQAIAAATASAALGGASPGGSEAAKAYAMASLARYGWGPDQWPPLDTLWAHESGWNPYAQNSIGAYGIPQAYGHGNVFALGDYKAQVDWGLNYIKQAYGSPAAAWAQWYKPDGTGSYAEGGPVGAYLTALRDQANVQAYLTALAKAKKVQPLGVFLQNATQLKLGAHDLAVRGLQDAYGMPARNSTWDQSTTDFLAVNSAHVGAKSAAIRYLQLALKRPVTGTLTSGDLPALYGTVNQVAFPNGSTYGDLLHQDANQTAFAGYLQTIVRRGFAPLAATLQQQGVDTALAGARQLASAPLGVLQKANAAAVRTSASSKYGDALNLAQDLAQYGGKVGLLGLASRSGSSVSDVLGLVTTYPQVFSSLGSTSKLLINDLDRISRGLQPVAAYADGAWEIKRDHVATVHQGELIAPKAYAEPWRRQAAAAGGGGGGLNVTFQAGAIPVVVGDIASMGQVRTEIKSAVTQTLGLVFRKAKAQTGVRP